MTLPDMHTQIRVQFEAIASYTLDNFLPREIDLYLNRAIREYINKHRPILLQHTENKQSRESLEKLRTVLYEGKYGSGDFSSQTEFTGGWSVPIDKLDPSYEFFISGRLSTDQDVYDIETVTLSGLYRHFETKNNIPQFRDAKIAERGNSFILALPDPDEQPEAIEMTYLGQFERVDIELIIEYTVSQGSGSNDASIDIEGVSYDIPWNTDAETTVDDFISNHKVDIRERHEVVASDYGDKVRMTTYNPDVLESEFDLFANDTETALTQNTIQPRKGIVLPSPGHQELVNITVNLMKQDLPQVMSDRQEAQAKQEA